ncbi:MAG: hypothetical protein JWM04_1364, partial [Verrucomicrobiales bacterium]|nr:hypothetical protein [Verrucomicrobiales bacterium]
MTSKPILIISLFANVGLIVAMTVMSKQSPGTEREIKTETEIVKRLPSTTSVQKTVVTNQTTVTFDWHAVESDDYKKYIANLRSVGCP